MRISRQLVPPGGWRYNQKGIMIYGDTFDDLAIHVRAHRQSNGMRLGDVEDDIEQQLARLHPSIVINKRYVINE